MRPTPHLTIHNMDPPPKCEPFFIFLVRLVRSCFRSAIPRTSRALSGFGGLGDVLLCIFLVRLVCSCFRSAIPRTSRALSGFGGLGKVLLCIFLVKLVRSSLLWAIPRTSRGLFFRKSRREKRTADAERDSPVRLPIYFIYFVISLTLLPEPLR